MDFLIFDLETNGLLADVNTIHSLVIKNVTTKEVISCANQDGYVPIDKGIELLMKADALIGHNIIGYDIPLLQESYDFETDATLVDTLVLSRLFYPHIADRDYERRPTGMPAKLYGRHSLEAWGYRLKCFKGDYGKGPDAWDQYTPEMLDYCIQDTAVTLKLYQLMLRRMKDYA